MNVGRKSIPPISRILTTVTPMRLPVLDAADFSDDRREQIAFDLRDLIEGDVRFTKHDRMLYATDASFYQVEPIGVVVPRSIADVERVVAYCAERKLPILPRGGGTSLAGQSVNVAVMIDFAPHCDRILEIDAAGKRARVEPGVVLAHLNQALADHMLMFGPDVATATHANLGGMIGNNSAGAHSVLYGRTVEHLIAMDVLLADGSRLTFDEGAAERNSRVRDLTQELAAIIMPIADEIEARFPKILRHVDGYNLDLLLDQLRKSTPGTLDRVNLAHVLCGSEGTLGVTVSATLNLVDAPRAKGLAVIAFADVDHALRAVGQILETKPAAVELVDDVVLGLAANNVECQRYLALMPEGAKISETASVLYVEYFADVESQLNEQFASLEKLLPKHPMRRFTEPAMMAQAWKLRASGEPLLHGLPGDRKPQTFVEDAAVDPRILPEFIRDFRALIDRHGTTAAYYAHASVGCLHVRPLINLRDDDDLRAMQQMAEELCDLVKRYGGALSGEHGDGRLRSHLLRRYYGETIFDAFAKIKAVFDPHNLLNPGNIIASPPMIEHLRTRPRQGEAHTRIPHDVQTFYRYERELGFAGAVEMCNGAGVCRKMSGGTMCPSYRATRDERHATRGRGNALRLAITGQFSSDGKSPAWGDPETHTTLDLCLSCKACKSECPSNVDLAKLKAEYLAQKYETTGRVPLATRVFGNVRTLNRLGSAIAPLANALNRFAPMRAIVNRLFDIHPQRSLPRFERNLFRWISQRPQPPHCTADAPRVILFPDCFTVYNEPAVGRAAIETLEALGFRVILPKLGCCGRSMISLGILREATRTCSKTARNLLTVIDEHDPIAIVGCEPSCISAITDDWPDLKLDVERERVRDIAMMTMLVEDFIALRWDDHPASLENPRRPDGPPILFHGHCHQKALYGLDAPSELFADLFGDRFRVIDSGCCGMAGSFGYTRGHFDLSMRIGELSLFPPIRDEPDAIILASGTSCRHQIHDALGRRSMHPVELLHDRLVTGHR